MSTTPTTPLAAPGPGPRLGYIDVTTLVPLTGLYGLSNRSVNGSVVDTIVFKYDPGACDPIKVYQEVPGAPTHIMCGHHRQPAFIRLGHRMIICELHTLACAKAAGKTGREYVENIVLCNNFHDKADTAAHLQLWQAESLWVSEFSNRGLFPEFEGRKRTCLNYSSILRAYKAALSALEQLKNERDPDDILETVKLGASRDEMTDLFLHPNKEVRIRSRGKGALDLVLHSDPEKLRRAVVAIARWDEIAADLYDNDGVNVWNFANLLGVLLLEFEPSNHADEGLQYVYSTYPRRFVREGKNGRYSDPKGYRKVTTMIHISHMLAHLNSGRPGYNLLRILGRETFSTRPRR